MDFIQGAEAPCSLRKAKTQTNTEILAIDRVQARMTTRGMVAVESFVRLS
jgi:hypothetical protein